jgi:hypothetical protein
MIAADAPAEDAAVDDGTAAAAAALAAAVERIAALEAELAAARRALAARGHVTGCGTPEHATAAARIDELSAALRRRTDARRGAFQQRLGAYRQRRLGEEIARLEADVALARATATGDPALLTELKAARERLRIALGPRRRPTTPGVVDYQAPRRSPTNQPSSAATASGGADGGKTE